MTETEKMKVELMIELFGWDPEPTAYFHALIILRNARKEPPPTWDDFKAGVIR